MPLVLTSEQIAFLNHQRVGRLATVTEDGQPHAVPICYALLDGLLYTPIDEKPKRGDPASLRRLRNIAANPRVCLVVDHYEEDWSRLAWLQVRGLAVLVDDAEERTRAIAALRGRYAQYRAMDLESRPVIRITPRRVVGWGEAPTPRPPLPGLTRDAHSQGGGNDQEGVKGRDVGGTLRRTEAPNDRRSRHLPGDSLHPHR